MADKTFITIAMRKEVADLAEAKAVIAIVKEKLQDERDISIQSSINIKVDDNE